MIPTEQPNIFIPKDLNEFEFVFVGVDEIRTALFNPYEKPYKVISRLFVTKIEMLGLAQLHITCIASKPVLACKFVHNAEEPD